MELLTKSSALSLIRLPVRITEGLKSGGEAPTHPRAEPRGFGFSGAYCITAALSPTNFHREKTQPRSGNPRPTPLRSAPGSASAGSCTAQTHRCGLLSTSKLELSARAAARACTAHVRAHRARTPRGHPSPLGRKW